MQILHWLPQHVRDEKLSQLKGLKAVKFPAAYFMRAPKSGHLRWVLLGPIDQNGFAMLSPNLMNFKVECIDIDMIVCYNSIVG